MQATDLLREIKRTVDELQAVSDIGKTLTSTLDVGEVLRIIMLKVSELLHPTSWSLLLADEKEGDLYFEVVVGERSDLIKSQRLALGEGIAGWVAAEGQPLLVTDPQADPRFSPRFDELTGSRSRCVLAVPLRSKGRTLGVIELVNSGEARAFGPEDLRTLATTADYAAIAIENARAFERISELTLIDDHTGLYNARHLYRCLDTELSRAKRFKRPFSVVFFDLDHFKEVNDRNGHQAGSAMLKEVADLLRVKLRTVDVATRYGGDEFVLLLPETDRAQALLVAERLRAAMSEREFLADRGLRVHVTASFGVSSFPDDASTAEDLLRLADTAMYGVKHAARDGVAAAIPMAPPVIVPT